MTPEMQTALNKASEGLLVTKQSMSAGQYMTFLLNCKKYIQQKYEISLTRPTPIEEQLEGIDESKFLSALVNLFQAEINILKNNNKSEH